jgi:predicted nucleotidyltransferase
MVIFRNYWIFFNRTIVYIRGMTKDPLVERVVEKIAAAIKPQKIFLFGSRVGNIIRKDSDIDLAVVYDGKKTKREIQMQIREIFPCPDFSLDLFILTPKELESQKRIANTLSREISENGVVCFG